jgi:homocysteine S-methyltransferase
MVSLHSLNPLRPLLEVGGGPVILDGGLATALEARGHVLDSDLWSARILLDEPEAIRAVHAAYLQAGAQCITTSSYQASFEGFGAIGVSEEDAEAALIRSSSLALEERDQFWEEANAGTGSRPKPVVAASVGPYGAYLADGSEYDGRYSIGRGELEDFHRRRFGVLAKSGVDVLACETVPSLEEACALLSLLDQEPDVWAWVSFSCRDGALLWDGTRIEDAVQLCARHERVAAIGVNCTAPGHVASLIGRAAAVTDLPLIAYPNSGEEYDASTRSWVGPDAGVAWMDAMEAAVTAGAVVVGGCCRIGPTMIAELRRRQARGDWQTNLTAPNREG